MQNQTDILIPSLTFTKAELAYVLFILLKDIPLTNTSSKIELVEARHYLNQIGEKVLLSTHDGTLRQAIVDAPGTLPRTEKPQPLKSQDEPSLEELKAQFPSLSESEIQEILASAKSDRIRKEEEKPVPEEPPLPYLIDSHSAEPSQSNEKRSVRMGDEEQDKETSKRFASLLGAF